jgi:hypothetical protein
MPAMPLFGRTKQAVPDGPPDETFPFFTGDQAARFRELARQGFAAAGLEVTVQADHLVDDSGRKFGLGNMAAQCHSARKGEREWREITATHAVRIVRGMNAPSPFDTMSRAELLAATYVRLMPTADLAPVSADYAREVTEGISEVLNVDLPETVVTYLDEHVARLGPVEDLRRAGLANLRRVPIDEHQRVAAPQGAALDVVMGDSVFTASKLLVLDELLAQLGVTEVDENGVLVVAPFRHQLAFHAIRDADAVAAVHGLALFAKLGHDGSPGPLSPHVYWWRGGELRCITENGPDGVQVYVDPELSEVFNRVC